MEDIWYDLSDFGTYDRFSCIKKCFFNFKYIGLVICERGKKKFATVEGLIPTFLSSSLVYYLKLT